MKDGHDPLSTVVGIALEDKGFALARRRDRVHAHDKAGVMETSLWRADGLYPCRVRWHVAMQDLQCFRRILELFEALAQECSWGIGRLGRGGV
jgi:hypothetical protein